MTTGTDVVLLDKLDKEVRNSCIIPGTSRKATTREAGECIYTLLADLAERVDKLEIKLDQITE